MNSNRFFDRDNSYSSYQIKINTNKINNIKKFEFRGLSIPINHSIENNNIDYKYNTDERENKKSIFKNDEKYQHHFFKNK
jgi:hypothetical protein